MDIFEKIKKIDTSTVIKFIGVIIVAMLLIGIVTSLGSFAFRTAFNTMDSSSRYGYGNSYEMQKGMQTSLSMRNTMAPDFKEDFSTGSDAEDFEIREYSASIRTRKLDSTCSKIENLKAKDYVIFENSNKNDNYCNYRFKVSKENVDEILAIIKELKPEDLNINTETIKRQIDDYTSEEDILKKRLAQIEETLTDAQKAYDEVSRLATNSRDVESMAKIINDKITLIEKLTSERLNTKNSLDRLSRAKAEQLDRLDYTFFSVSVSEYLIIDSKALKDSWVREMQDFVREFNNLLQGVSIKLLLFATMLIQIAIYLTIALFVAKYGWRFVKYVWKK